MTLKNTLLLTALATALMGTAAMANPKADTNQDGVITRAEFLAASDARFAKSDLNGDGYISTDERETARTNRDSERRSEHFTRMDANGDGVITRDEFDSAGDMRKSKKREKMRQRMDVNQDGQVDDSDREVMRQKMEGRREKFKEMREKRRAEGGRDGARDGWKKSGRRGGKDMLSRVDTNGDDLISAQEYREGAETMFDHMDANGDGQLTEGEGMRRKRGKKRRRGR